MKTKILMLLFMGMTLDTMGQAPVWDGRVADTTAAFTVNISVGTKVYSITEESVWVCTESADIGMKISSNNFSRFTQLATGAAHDAVTLGTANGLSLTGQQLSLGTSSSSTTGALTSTDWSTFNGKQAGDADLTALAGVSTTGVHVRTGSGTATTRTITGTANEITVTNGDGVSGNPTLSLVLSKDVVATGPVKVNGSTNVDNILPGADSDLTISIDNAAADGTTKGAASFTANDFDATSGNISIDYTNGQAASAGAKGFLTAADWSTFNGKDGSVTNEGSLSVGAGAANTSTINSNTSGSAAVTISGGTNISVTESSNTITIATTGVYTAKVEDFEMSTNDSAAVAHYHYTLAQTPQSGSISVEVNGMNLKPTTQYTVVSGNKIRIGFAIMKYDKITVSYSY